MGVLARFRMGRRASAGLEFAIIAPVMGTMVVGVFDITRAMIAYRQVTNVAQSVTEIATEMSVQADQTTSLTTTQARTAMTAIYALIPGLKSGADNSAFSVTLSAVVFSASPSGCSGAGCTYTGNVAWSTYLAQGSTALRACGKVAQVAAGTAVTMSNLPTAGMTALTSVLVADVSYTYTPLFTSFVTGSFVMSRTAMLPPRSGPASQYVQYDIAGYKTDPSVCAGYV